MRYRICVFDFDGTIADTLGETRRIYNEIAPDYGLRQVAPDEVAGMRHMSLKQLIKHLGIPKRRVPVLLKRGTGMMRGNMDALQMIPGVREVLFEMRNHVDGFGVLTSNSASNVEAFMEKHEVRELFEFISSTSRLTGKAKHLRAIRKTFSLAHHELLYVGDELRDVKASKKAKIPVAAVTWGFNSAESLAQMEPEHLLNAPHEFRQLFEAQS